MPPGVLAVPRALASGEPQLALHEGTVLWLPRLARAGSGGVLVAPEGVGEWRLSAGAEGTLEDLSLVPLPRWRSRLSRGRFGSVCVRGPELP